MGISLPEPSADFSKNRILRIVILAINILILILGLILMLGAAFLAIRTDAAGQVLGFAALLGAAFFVVSGVGICGVTRYDALLFVYFVVTLFIAVIALFLTVFVIVKRDEIDEAIQKDLQENWTTRYESLGEDVQTAIADIFENKGGIFCDQLTECSALACCGDGWAMCTGEEEENVVCCATTWFDTCINTPVLPTECYDEVKAQVAENLGIVVGMCAALVLIACVPLGLVVKIMGIHEIVKHSQLITTICLAVVSLCVCIAGGMFAGYLAQAGINSLAPFGYAILVFGAFLLITSIVTLVGHIKGNTVLQFVSTILFAVLALVFLLLMIFCFAFQTRAVEYMNTDCEANDSCSFSVSECWKTEIVSDAEDSTCSTVDCAKADQCAMFVYHQAELEALASLSEDIADCQDVIDKWEESLAENVNAFVEGQDDDECNVVVRTYDATAAFFGESYSAWVGSVISYMDTAGYACAVTFLFCVVQVGASYYVTKTESELQ